MKLAYFSPLPPQKSGISDYSEALLPHLSRYFDIDLWISGVAPESSLSEKYRIIDYHKSEAPLSNLKNYDCILYNIGNNPEFHAEMYDVFLKYPGHVILHDFVLFFLVTGYFLEYKRDREGYIREFYENYGNEGIYEVKKILRGCVPPLQFKNPEWYPLIKKIIQTSHGLIVHSESTKKLLILNGGSPDTITKINQINYSNMNFNSSGKEQVQIKQQFGINSDSLLITSLGYIAPTKRNAQIIKAVNEIIPSLKKPVQYLMVGDGNYIDGLLNQNIKKTGFVSKGDYEKLISCSDIIVNLRYPSMGETSATLLQAMTGGKPCIISDIGWFSELPDNTVVKIPAYGINEQQLLEKSLRLLLEDPEKRKELGNNAYSYVSKYHNPTTVAEQFFDVLHKDPIQHNLSDSYAELNFNRMKEIFIDDTNLFLKKYQQKNVVRQREIGLIDDGLSYLFRDLKNIIANRRQRDK